MEICHNANVRLLSAFEFSNLWVFLSMGYDVLLLLNGRADSIFCMLMSLSSAIIIIIIIITKTNVYAGKPIGTIMILLFLGNKSKMEKNVT